MYRREQVIWIDGTRFTCGALTSFLAFVSYGLAWLLWNEPYSIVLFSATVLLIQTAVYLFWRAWRVGRQRKANYDNRLNKVLPRGSKTNADMLF